jgi:4-nitrophenyl phosphatase
MDIKGILFDLDGTVYLGEREVAGASEFINGLKSRGVRPMFVTNRSNRDESTVCKHLRGYGIECAEDDIISTAYATALHLKKGSYYAIGEKNLFDTLDRNGFIYDETSPDYVIVSFDRDFDYKKLSMAVRLIYSGSKFVATNPDCALKMYDTILPGTGAITAAVEAGAGVAPLIVGKPERVIFDIAIERMGIDRAEVIAVGDNLLTDIPAGAAAGIRTALILTGMSSRSDVAASAVEPTWIVEDYNELQQVCFGG